MLRFGDAIEGDDEAERSWRAERPSAHDLRRTFNSRMAALGVPQEIRDRLLNHTPASIEGRHYNAHDYFAEKRRALLQWDAALAGILSDRPATVVPSVRHDNSPGAKTMRFPKANDPIPERCITHSDAFMRYYRLVTPSSAIARSLLMEKAHGEYLRLANGWNRLLGEAEISFEPRYMRAS